MIERAAQTRQWGSGYALEISTGHVLGTGQARSQGKYQRVH